MLRVSAMLALGLGTAHGHTRTHSSRHCNLPEKPHAEFLLASDARAWASVTKTCTSEMMMKRSRRKWRMRRKLAGKQAAVGRKLSEVKLSAHAMPNHTSCKRHVLEWDLCVQHNRSNHHTHCTAKRARRHHGWAECPRGWMAAVAMGAYPGVPPAPSPLPRRGYGNDIFYRVDTKIKARSPPPRLPRPGRAEMGAVRRVARSATSTRRRASRAT
jgi:hypothetical protein